MTYVALLRGINVGGNRKVDMQSLRAVFEQAGLNEVKTYINSGNVIFNSNRTDANRIAKELESAIEAKFGFNVRVLLRDLPNMEAVLKALPDTWLNNSDVKCDVLFLWPEADKPGLMKRLPVREGIDNVTCVPGAVLWSVDRDKATRSGIMKLVGTELYAHMTIRNCNTARKLLILMREQSTRQ